MRVRIIAKLDVKPPYVVKPVHFEGLRKIGNPKNLVDKYYLQGADEIFYIDIVSSLYQREILFDQIESSSKGAFIPFAVGGGIKTIEDCERLFESGADKVVINTYALQHNSDLIREVSQKFGSQSVVVNIEAKKISDNWECCSDCGREQSGINVIDWVKKIEHLGAGEILLQSIDKDGRNKGFDLALVKNVVDAVSIPVVAASGAGSLDDVLSVIQYAQPAAVALASLLHYDVTTIQDVKSFLAASGIEVSL